MVAQIIQIQGYMTIKFHELWARVLLSYSDEYQLVLRLVVITLLVPADASECERVFSSPQVTKEQNDPYIPKIPSRRRRSEYSVLV